MKFSAAAIRISLWMLPFVLVNSTAFAQQSGGGVLEVSGQTTSSTSSAATITIGVSHGQSTSTAAKGWYTEPASVYGSNYALYESLAQSETITASGSTGLNGFIGSGSDLITLTADGSFTIINTLTFGGTKATDSTLSASSPSLSGGIMHLKIKTTNDKSILRVKATVYLRNSTGQAFRHVTATVYLSDDGALSSDDMKLRTLSLADYVPKGKIGKGKTLSMPFNQKVPTVLASYVAGKYLIVVLDADNLGTLAGDPIVVGPITLPGS